MLGIISAVTVSARNNAVLNDWYLECNDIVVGRGNFLPRADTKELLLVKR